MDFLATAKLFVTEQAGGEWSDNLQSLVSDRTVDEDAGRLAVLLREAYNAGVEDAAAKVDGYDESAIAGQVRRLKVTP
jgi:hypothetical protein